MRSTFYARDIRAISHALRDYDIAFIRLAKYAVARTVLDQQVCFLNTLRPGSANTQDEPAASCYFASSDMHYDEHNVQYECNTIMQPSGCD